MSSAEDALALSNEGREEDPVCRYRASHINLALANVASVECAALPSWVLGWVIAPRLRLRYQHDYNSFCGELACCMSSPGRPRAFWEPFACYYIGYVLCCTAVPHHLSDCRSKRGVGPTPFTQLYITPGHIMLYQMYNYLVQ